MELTRPLVAMPSPDMPLIVPSVRLSVFDALSALMPFCPPVTSVPLVVIEVVRSVAPPSERMPSPFVPSTDPPVRFATLLAPSSRMPLFEPVTVVFVVVTFAVTVASTMMPSPLLPLTAVPSPNAPLTVTVALSPTALMPELAPVTVEPEPPV